MFPTNPSFLTKPPPPVQDDSAVEVTSKRLPHLTWKLILQFLIFPIGTLLHYTFKYTQLYMFPITIFTFWHILPFYWIATPFIWNPIQSMIGIACSIGLVGLMCWKSKTMVVSIEAVQGRKDMMYGIVFMIVSLWAVLIATLGVKLCPKYSMMWFLLELISTTFFTYGYSKIDNQYFDFVIHVSMNWASMFVWLNIAVSAIIHASLFAGVSELVQWRMSPMIGICCACLILSSFLLSLDFIRIFFPPGFYQFHMPVETKEEYEENIKEGLYWTRFENGKTVKAKRPVPQATTKLI
ncbi:unnamed protein product [Caenorhabditis brenneri]